ncbi:MAG: DsbA family protein, partial [Oleispira sp.]|nr:DsbA family protein [Oleispira sp.]
MNKVQIDYYSDLLCIWAYIGHARTCELQKQFPQQLEWVWHYLPVFGDVRSKLHEQWQDRGGLAVYAYHVKNVAADFNHIKLNKACWTSVKPVSSAPAHLWLAATRLAEQAGYLPEKSEENLAWALRTAFFEQAIDIAKQQQLIDVSNGIGLDGKAILDRIVDGTAYAVLCQDMLTARDSNIRISPTYVLNNDR